MQKEARMAFRRYGSSYHLIIENAKDLQQVLPLNEAHLVANNAPITTINCDKTFLSQVDADSNGRITCHEVRSAIYWLFDVLREYDGVTERSQVLHLNHINTNNPEGQKIHSAAVKMLGRLKQKDTGQVTLAQVRQIKSQVESMPVSEAGVVLPEAAKDAEVRQFIADILETVGGVPHPSGTQGIGLAQLEKFLSSAKAYVKWHEQGQIPAKEGKSAIMPLGSGTAVAYEVFAAVRSKLDQYFAQCEALALDERFLERMGWTQAELEALDFDDTEVIGQVLKKGPLAKPDSSGVLDFEKQINPHYVPVVEKFREQIMLPLLGECGPRLSTQQWQQIKSFLNEHDAWVQAKPGDFLESLGLEKLRKYLDARFAQAVRALIADSVNTAFVLDNVRLVEKLILYQAHIIDLANNFVSFPHLYDRGSRAMFEMGTLVMDGTRFNLAVKVDNRPQHTQVAKTSNMYVLYVEVGAEDQSRRFEVAVPVTAGGKGNLCIGKRGVFYDVTGNELDARVLDIIENPISFREALSAPFRRLGRLLTGKIESLTAEAEKKLDSQTSAALSGVAREPASAGPARAPGGGTPTAGLLMGAGVAVAALGSAAAYITKTLAHISPLKIIVFVLGAAASVMLATSIVAFLKLRRRDLSAILEGSGWGINARMRLSHRQGRFFTERPKYVKGSKGVHQVFRKWLIFLLLASGLLIGGVYFLKSRSGSRLSMPVQPQESQPAAEK